MDRENDRLQWRLFLTPEENRRRYNWLVAIDGFIDSLQGLTRWLEKKNREYDKQDTTQTKKF